MKKVLTVLLMICPATLLMAQDVIKMKDNSEKKVLVTEISGYQIKYKMADLPDGPVISMPKRTALSVTFRNGVTDMLGNENPRRYKPLGVGAIFSIDPSRSDYGLIGAAVDYFFTPQIKAEVQIGTDLEEGIIVCAGPKIYFNSSASSAKLVPFTGIMVGSYDGADFLQFPAGVDLQLKPGFTVSLGVNYMDFFYGDDLLAAEIKAGWRFKL
jgi:hypothetical protein